MKKIFISLLAVAAIAACTKSEVNYEAPAEIGFNVVAGNITKAPVDGDVYPTALNMYVNAYVHNTTVPTEPDYINNGEFTYLSTYGVYDSSDESATDAEKGTNVWGGGSSSSARNPYYWPNQQTLHFSGFSKSGNVETLLKSTTSTPVTYDPSTDMLSIKGYNPGTSTNDGGNDLMWFPSTKNADADGYDKNTKFVPVSMYHTCAWITFLVKGDNVTGADASTYTVTDLKIINIDTEADVECTYSNNAPVVTWKNNTDSNGSFDVLSSGSVSLANTTTDAVDAETDNNVVVIPQTPGKLELTYTYESSTGATITEPYEGEKALDLSLAKDASSQNGPVKWEPGKHYIYTITIKANEILVAPAPVDWTDSNWNITVE